MQLRALTEEWRIGYDTGGIEDHNSSENLGDPNSFARRTQSPRKRKAAPRPTGITVLSDSPLAGVTEAPAQQLVGGSQLLVVADVEPQLLEDEAVDRLARVQPDEEVAGLVG
jgi:hypothetical protein